MNVTKVKFPYRKINIFNKISFIHFKIEVLNLFCNNKKINFILMLYITRKEHFSSSHKLENPDLSKEKNEEVFGKCSNFHGHNYYIEVTLAGTPDPESNYVMDLKLLKKIIHEEILDKVDHKYLKDVEMFNGIIPTTENMTVKFWEILKDKVKRNNVSLYSVKLYETEKNYVEYRGE